MANNSKKQTSKPPFVSPLTQKKLASAALGLISPDSPLAVDTTCTDNSQIYEGEWKGDKRHGHGVIKCTGSYTYYGQWVNNARTGYGVMSYENGGKEEGQWQCGQLIVALKRKKIHLKSHQLETRVQQAYTQAIQAADSARNKAQLAESRTVSATSKFKMALVVCQKAEKNALLAREAAELYKNAPKISGRDVCGGVHALYVSSFAVSSVHG